MIRATYRTDRSSRDGFVEQTSRLEDSTLLDRNRSQSISRYNRYSVNNDIESVDDVIAPTTLWKGVRIAIRTSRDVRTMPSCRKPIRLFGVLRTNPINFQWWASPLLSPLNAQVVKMRFCPRHWILVTHSASKGRVKIDSPSLTRFEVVLFDLRCKFQSAKYKLDAQVSMLRKVAMEIEFENGKQEDVEMDRNLLARSAGK